MMKDKKEPNYVVRESILMPSKIIYAGIMTKPDSTGLSFWKTQKDVTQMVQNAFIMHYVAKTKEHLKKTNAKGTKWNFDLDEFDVSLTIKKKTNANTDGEKEIEIQNERLIQIKDETNSILNLLYSLKPNDVWLISRIRGVKQSLIYEIQQNENKLNKVFGGV